MKVDILAIGVHPDDIELSASGTLLKHIDLGYTVGLLDLTLGELGTRGNAQLRTEEAMQAAKLMGAKFRIQLDMPDGFFTHNEENIRKIIRVIRSCKPDIVLCNSVEDRHPDHGRAAKLTADACFYSGLRRIETETTEGVAQEAWRPKHVYHYIQDRALKPDFAVDITQYIDKKFELIMAFRSQFYDPTNNEPVTPISGKDFLDAIRGKDATYGRYLGVTYAEGYITARTVGVKNLFDLL